LALGAAMPSIKCSKIIALGIVAQRLTLSKMKK